MYELLQYGIATRLKNGVPMLIKFKYKYQTFHVQFRT